MRKPSHFAFRILLIYIKSLSQYDVLFFFKLCGVNKSVTQYMKLCSKGENPCNPFYTTVLFLYPLKTSGN